MEKNAVSRATLGRLPDYLQYLRQLPQGEAPYISAAAIARHLALGEVQVRKDLSAVSGKGKPKIGYATDDLIKSLEGRLGTSCLTQAILAGAGRLGKALLEYDAFEDYGVKIVAAFDCNEETLRPGKTIEILPVREMEAFCKARDIRIGIITVGQGSAQAVCDQMIGCGISAIWNFAPCRLHVPDHVLVRQENLALSLAHLNNQLQNTF